MAINITLVVIGLIICFGGIYIKKICSFSLGFIWGAISSCITVLAITGFSLFSLMEFDKEELMIIVGLGIVFGIASAIYEKICVAVSTFLSFFSISTLLMLLLDMLSGIYIYIITAIISFLLSFISIKLYNYVFIFFSALTGAFIATIGGYGLYKEIEFYNVIKKLLFDENSRIIILIATTILSIIGFFIQLYRFNFITKKKSNNEEKKIKPTEKLSEFKISFVKMLKAFSNNFIISEYFKRWYFYIFPFIFVFSEFGLFNYVLSRAILYFIISLAIFTIFNKNTKQIILWLFPIIFLLAYDVINFLKGEINIYLFTNFLCTLLTSSGIIILVCFLVILVKIFVKKQNKPMSFKASSIISFISVFLSFLIINYFLHFRNNFVPTGHFYKGVPFNEGILLSIEAIALFFIFNVIKDLNKSSNTLSVIKEKVLDTIPTLITFAICFTSVFFANIISDRIEESKFKTKHECYNEIISIYRQAATEGLQAFYDNQDYYYTEINDLLVNAYYNYNMSIQYALYDIDKNKTKELIISNGEYIYDIYTIIDNQSVNLFPDGTLGYRWFVEILENGQLLTHGLGGSYSGSAEIYDFIDGNLSISKKYYFENNTDSDDYDESSYTDYYLNEGYEIISEDEYRDKINELKSYSAFDSLKFTTIFESKE